MPHLARIAVHPIKALDPQERETARFVENGGLAGDREFAMVDPGGDYVNGKRTAAVHRLRATYDPDLAWADLRVSDAGDRQRDDDHGDGDLNRPVADRDGERFPLRDAADHERLTAFLTDHFGTPVTLRRDRAGGMPDDTDESGPTVVSTATVREVASWFEDVEPDGIRHRIRANLEVGGVDPFWEDRLYAADGPVRFRVGDVTIRGTGPCRRCVVPARDPWTGEETPGFQQRFVEKRRETLPEWAPESRFETFFKLVVNTRVPQREWGETIAVGDDVEILGPE